MTEVIEIETDKINYQLLNRIAKENGMTAKEVIYQAINVFTNNKNPLYRIVDLYEGGDDDSVKHNEIYDQ